MRKVVISYRGYDAKERIDQTEPQYKTGTLSVPKVMKGKVDQYGWNSRYECFS